MAFPSQLASTPTSIGKIWHVICDNPSEADTIRYIFQVLDQDGVVMRTVPGNELPQIDAPHTANLVAFVAAQRVKAEATLPPPA